MLSREVNCFKVRAAACYLMAMLTWLPAQAAEEPGRVDFGFNAFASGAPPNVPSGLYVQAIAEQPGGKILFSGPFIITAPSFSQRYLVRAFPNGDIDVNFRVTLDGTPSEIAVHGDGSIIIAGGFSTVNGQPRNQIARLHESGALDVSFNPSSVPLYRIENVYRCADGTTVAKVWLTNSLGEIVKRVVRLNHQGTLDPAFDVTVEPSYYYYSWSTERNENLWRLVAATPRSWGNPPGADERFYIIGGFTSVNGIARTNLARLLPDGTLDTSFAPGMIPFPDSLYSQSSTKSAAQPGGRLIVWDGTNTFRLNTDGSLDPTFNGGTGFVPGGGPVTVQADGRILVQAPAPDGIPRSRLWRLNSDGTFDWSFHGGTGPTNTTADYIRDYTVVSPLTDGKIMVGGGFNGIDGSWRAIIARLYGGDLTPAVPRILKHPDSQALREFQPMTLSSDAISFEKPSIEWHKDGLRLPGGTNLSISVESVSPSDAGEYTVVFSNSVGAVTSTVARVTVDPPATGAGSLDLQYAGAIISWEEVLNLTIDRDDRALVSVQSDTPLRRLNYDGLPDSTFKLERINGVDGAQDVYTVLITPGEDLQIGGYFESVGSLRRNNVARLKPDGELDPSFDPVSGVGGNVYDSALDPDGKTVIAGSFFGVNGTPRRSIARLNRDGSLDLNFNAANVFSNYSYGRQVIRLPTGKYLLDATNRLNPDGTVDNLYYVGPTTGSIHTSAALPNGDILIAGSFINVSSLPRNLIARLRALDGLVDVSFSSPPLYSLPREGIYDMALQPDGKIVIAGRFGIGIGSPVSNAVVRLNPNGTLDTTFTPAVVEGDSGSWPPLRVDKLAIQSDSSILVGGSFTLINGYPRTNLARLNGDRVIAASAPTAQTGTATNITFLSATLSGLANPHDAATRVYLEYGTSTSYGSVTAFAKLPAGTNDVSVTFNATNLIADTTYHYRMVATNRIGVAFGEAREFTTSSRPPEPRIDSPARFGNGGIEFSFPGEPGRSYTVMVSTNLIDWTEAGSALEINAGTFKFSDGQPSSPATKFYRLRTP